MNSLVYHIVSGQSFFSGVLLVVFAAGLSIRRGLPSDSDESAGVPRSKRRISVIAFLCGGLAIAVSSTALPYWVYILATAVSGIWLVSLFRKTASATNRRPAFGMIAVWLFAAAGEFPSHRIPTLEPAPSRKMAVIGDSVTAGVGQLPDTERWPGLLASRHHLTVQDCSRAGETAGSALSRIRKGDTQIDCPVVFLEIGGNDVLGSTTAFKFAEDLDALLAAISSPGRQIMMLELPLPPFFNDFGLAQRRLARKHDVALVPRRVLLSALAAENATLDTIHLSRTGHRSMATLVWQLIESAFPGNSTPPPDEGQARQNS